MESEENVGLSDIIDILNTLDSPLDQNGAVAIDTASPLEGQQMSSAVQQQQPPQPQQQMPQASQPKSKSPQARLRHSQSASEPGTDYSNVYVNTSATPSTSNNINNNNTSTSGGGGHRHKPYIKILEQPNGKILRFRYKCEGRSAGSIPGVNSTAENKTFPTIEIMNYTGEVVVVVSCVTKDPPYRPHPHNLVGKEGCKDGVCTLTLSGEPLRAVFSNLGIQCVKKRDIKEALDKRESIKVDPFKTKFGHKDQPSSIDLNAVRLCFQAFLKTPDAVKPLTPVVSDPIYDKKAMCNLMICRLCSCSAKVGGGDEIILLCEKITKNDIKVKFFEVNAEGQRVWEDFAEFQQTDIHRQTAIAFKTPRYHSVDISEKARVFIQLLRPSDGMTSEPLPFEYYPDPDQIRRKRIKTGGNPMNILRRELQRHEQMQNSNLPNDFKDISASNANFWNSPFPPAIKTEPTPTSPDRFGSHRSPYIASPSPQPLSPLNRIETPSPGLMKAMSAGSQAQMCEMFSFNTLRDLKSPSVFMQQQQQPQQQQQLQQQSSLEQQQAQFVNGNPFISNCNKNIVNNNNNNNNACDENKFVPVSTPNGSSNGLNPFIDHYTLAPHTSGGSITPIWTTQDQTPNLPHFDQFNIPAQQQQQEMLQLPNDIDMLTNGAPSEEVLTLSGLLDLVDNVQ